MSIVHPLPHTSLSTLELPLQLMTVSAGFPSPAMDFVERRTTLDSIVGLDPRYTYLVEVAGDSMIDVGIWPGDVAVVNRRLPLCPGQIIIATLNAENTIKRYNLTPEGRPVLQPENPRYAPIYPQEADEWAFEGVVTYTLRNHSRAV